MVDFQSSGSSGLSGFFRNFRAFTGTATAGTWAWLDSAGSTIAAISATGSAGDGYFYTSTATQNDTYTWTCYLPRGTYKIRAWVYRNTDAGIISVLDSGNNVLTTLDQYGAGAANILLEGSFTITGSTTSIAVKLATKNGSSSGYAVRIQTLTLEKTG